MEYGGWIYSSRDSQSHRRSLGGEPIEIGKLHCADAVMTIAALGRCLARRREKPGDEIDSVVAIS